MVRAEVKHLAILPRRERRRCLVHLHSTNRVSFHNFLFHRADARSVENLQFPPGNLHHSKRTFSRCVPSSKVRVMDNRASAILLENLDEFVAFARARVGDPEMAADLVQDSLLKAIMSGGELRDSESSRAWFYRILRHAIIDLYRRRDGERKALEKLQVEEPDANADKVICRCLDRLIPTLKPEYASVLRAIDLQEQPIERAARELGISVNNANVRLHRARRQLREKLEATCRVCATHGCLDCMCE